MTEIPNAFLPLTAGSCCTDTAQSLGSHAAAEVISSFTRCAAGRPEAWPSSPSDHDGSPDHTCDHRRLQECLRPYLRGLIDAAAGEQEEEEDANPSPSITESSFSSCPWARYMGRLAAAAWNRNPRYVGSQLQRQCIAAAAVLMANGRSPTLLGHEPSDTADATSSLSVTATPCNRSDIESVCSDADDLLAVYDASETPSASSDGGDEGSSSSLPPTMLLRIATTDMPATCDSVCESTMTTVSAEDGCTGCPPYAPFETNTSVAHPSAIGSPAFDVCAVRPHTLRLCGAETSIRLFPSSWTTITTTTTAISLDDADGGSANSRNATKRSPLDDRHRQEGAAFHGGGVLGALPVACVEGFKGFSFPLLAPSLRSIVNVTLCLPAPYHSFIIIPTDVGTRGSAPEAPARDWCVPAWNETTNRLCRCASETFSTTTKAPVAFVNVTSGAVIAGRLVVCASIGAAESPTTLGVTGTVGVVAGVLGSVAGGPAASAIQTGSLIAASNCRSRRTTGVNAAVPVRLTSGPTGGIAFLAVVIVSTGSLHGLIVLLLIGCHRIQRPKKAPSPPPLPPSSFEAKEAHDDSQAVAVTIGEQEVSEEVTSSATLRDHVALALGSKARFPALTLRVWQLCFQGMAFEAIQVLIAATSSAAGSRAIYDVASWPADVAVAALALLWTFLFFSMVAWAALRAVQQAPEMITTTTTTPGTTPAATACRETTKEDAAAPRKKPPSPLLSHSWSPPETLAATGATPRQPKDSPPPASPLVPPSAAAPPIPSPGTTGSTSPTPLWHAQERASEPSPTGPTDGHHWKFGSASDWRPLGPSGRLSFKALSFKALSFKAATGSPPNLLVTSVESSSLTPLDATTTSAVNNPLSGSRGGGGRTTDADADDDGLPLPDQPARPLPLGRFALDRKSNSASSPNLTASTISFRVLSDDDNEDEMPSRPCYVLDDTTEVKPCRQHDNQRVGLFREKSEASCGASRLDEPTKGNADDDDHRPPQCIHSRDDDDDRQQNTDADERVIHANGDDQDPTSGHLRQTVLHDDDDDDEGAPTHGAAAVTAPCAVVTVRVIPIFQAYRFLSGAFVTTNENGDTTAISPEGRRPGDTKVGHTPRGGRRDMAVRCGAIVLAGLLPRGYWPPKHPFNARWSPAYSSFRWEVGRYLASAEAVKALVAAALIAPVPAINGVDCEVLFYVLAAFLWLFALMLVVARPYRFLLDNALGAAMCLDTGLLCIHAANRRFAAAVTQSYLVDTLLYLAVISAAVSTVQFLGETVALQRISQGTATSDPFIVCQTGDHHDTQQCHRYPVGATSHTAAYGFVQMDAVVTSWWSPLHPPVSSLDDADADGSTRQQATSTTTVRGDDVKVATSSMRRGHSALDATLSVLRRLQRSGDAASPRAHLPTRRSGFRSHGETADAKGVNPRPCANDDDASASERRDAFAPTHTMLMGVRPSSPSSSILLGVGHGGEEGGAEYEEGGHNADNAVNRAAARRHRRVLVAHINHRHHDPPCRGERTATNVDDGEGNVQWDATEPPPDVHGVSSPHDPVDDLEASSATRGALPSSFVVALERRRHFTSVAAAVHLSSVLGLVRGAPGPVVAPSPPPSGTHPSHGNTDRL